MHLQIRKQTQISSQLHLENNFDATSYYPNAHLQLKQINCTSE